MNIHKTNGDRITDVIIYVFLMSITIVTLYPFIYVLFASVSNMNDVSLNGSLLLWPKEFVINAYVGVLKNPNIAYGYRNTIFYTALGTAINVILTIMAAYVLSRKWLYGRNILMLIITVTMFFGGGLIPTYLLVKNLNLINTIWAMVLPTAVSTYNIIITRTFFMGIPDSLEESAKIDGANDIIVMCLIMVPLSMPIIAVNILIYSVGHWNTWFNALIYIKDRSMYPLQMFLREILIQSQVNDMNGGSAIYSAAENIKYATVIVTILPIIFVYPFVQKYFVQGIMIGSLKG